MEKTNFSFASGYQLELAVRNGDVSSSFLYWSVPTPVSASLYEGLVFLVSSIPSGSYTLLSSSSTGFPNPGDLFMKAYYFPPLISFLTINNSVVDLLTVFTSDYLLKGNTWFRMLNLV